MLLCVTHDCRTSDRNTCSRNVDSTSLSSIRTSESWKILCEVEMASSSKIRNSKICRVLDSVSCVIGVPHTSSLTKLHNSVSHFLMVTQIGSLTNPLVNLAMFSSQARCHCIAQWYRQFTAIRLKLDKVLRHWFAS